MSIKIEFRYAVLTALLMLLWLIIEYVVGLQDTFISIHPYVSLLAYAIQVFTYRLALNEKLDQKYGKLSFGQAFFTCFLMTLFVCLLSIPVLMAFFKLINPGFFANMISYAVETGKSSPEQAAQYFNQNSYLIESVIGNFAVGTLISLILALRMRTV